MKDWVREEKRDSSWIFPKKRTDLVALANLHHTGNSETCLSWYTIEEETSPSATRILLQVQHWQLSRKPKKTAMTKKMAEGKEKENEREREKRPVTKIASEQMQERGKKSSKEQLILPFYPKSFPIFEEPQAWLQIVYFDPSLHL